MRGKEWAIPSGEAPRRNAYTMESSETRLPVIQYPPSRCSTYSRFIGASPVLLYITRQDVRCWRKMGPDLKAKARASPRSRANGIRELRGSDRGDGRPRADPGRAGGADIDFDVCDLAVG